MRRLIATLAACCPVLCAAASWQPVPGAADVGMDLASIEQQRNRIVLWVRWWGHPALLAQAPAPRAHRTMLRVEFDCGARTVRMLAAEAQDGAGKPLFMSSVPGPVQPVRGEELAWTYDAACELARTVN